MLRSLPNGKQTPSGAPSPTNNISDNVRYVRHEVRGQFSLSLSAGGKSGNRSLCERFRRLSAPRLLACGRVFPASVCRKSFSPPRLSSSAFVSFSSRHHPPGTSFREGPHPIPWLFSSPPQGGRRKQHLSASPGLRSRVFSLRARPAFDRASASDTALFRAPASSPSRFFTPTSTASRPAKPPRDRRNRRFRGDRRPRFSAPSADLRTVASARLRAVAVAP